MPDVIEVSSSFAKLSLSLAEDAHQAGDDERAGMFIELARAIFDLNEQMASRREVEPPIKARRLQRTSGGVARQTG
jgi:hypothetical protein